MHANLWLSPLILASAALAACGTSTSSNVCVVKTAIMPTSATADHGVAAPGDQVQFSLSSSRTGNCPLTPDVQGVWSTSDPVNTAISNEAATAGLATCMHATTTPATISNSSTVTGHSYPTASLTCK